MNRALYVDFCLELCSLKYKNRSTLGLYRMTSVPSLPVQNDSGTLLNGMERRLTV